MQIQHVSAPTIQTSRSPPFQKPAHPYIGKLPKELAYLVFLCLEPKDMELMARVSKHHLAFRTHPFITRELPANKRYLLRKLWIDIKEVEQNCRSSGQAVVKELEVCGHTVERFCRKEDMQRLHQQAIKAIEALYVTVPTASLWEFLQPSYRKWIQKFDKARKVKEVQKIALALTDTHKNQVKRLAEGKSKKGSQSDPGPVRLPPPKTKLEKYLTGSASKKRLATLPSLAAMMDFPKLPPADFDALIQIFLNDAEEINRMAKIVETNLQGKVTDQEIEMAQKLESNRDFYRVVERSCHWKLQFSTLIDAHVEEVKKSLTSRLEMNDAR